MAFTLTAIEEGIENKIYADIHKMSMFIADNALDGRCPREFRSQPVLVFVGFADTIHNQRKLGPITAMKKLRIFL